MSVSGVSAAASVSSVSVGGDISVTVTGLSGTSSVGSVSLVMDVTITLTGLGATGSVGAVTVSAGVRGHLPLALGTILGYGAIAQIGMMALRGLYNGHIFGW